MLSVVGGVVCAKKSLNNILRLSHVNSKSIVNSLRLINICFISQKHQPLPYVSNALDCEFSEDNCLRLTCKGSTIACPAVMSACASLYTQLQLTSNHSSQSDRILAAITRTLESVLIVICRVNVL